MSVSLGRHQLGTVWRFGTDILVTEGPFELSYAVTGLTFALWSSKPPSKINDADFWRNHVSGGPESPLAQGTGPYRLVDGRRAWARCRIQAAQLNPRVA